MTPDVTSKNIQGIADLVVCAPIKQGFIDAFENITFETRLRIVAETFHKLTVIGREYASVKPFTDAAERIQSLLAFRIGILDTQPAPSLILAATFDRAWEPYMRLIWKPLGTFLDLIFCNCQDYVSAADHTFPEYAKWVRDHQVDSMNFYATTPLTVGDQLYLSKLERWQRDDASDREIAGITADDPIDLAKAVRAKATVGSPGYGPAAQASFLTMAVEALAVIYGLADYYPPDRLKGDGKYLLRAAQAVFEGWNTRRPEQLPVAVRQQFLEMFEWLEKKAPSQSNEQAESRIEHREVQGGILSSHDDKGEVVKHGCLLMFGATDARAARDFIDTLRNEVCWDNDPKPKNAEGAFVNIAFTCGGLANLDLPAKLIEGFPKEFREGVEARAGLVGDIQANHPQRWRRPERFKPAIAAGQAGYIRPRVELSEIDFVIQLRTANGDWGFVDLPNSEAGLKASTHPLVQAILRMAGSAAVAGVRLLAIQPMRRLLYSRDAQGNVRTQEHFGFADPVSQPGLEGKGVLRRDTVKPGELVLGYANSRGDPAPPNDAVARFQKNGAFLVVRKMRQNVEGLKAFVAANATIDGELLLAKMVGRYADATRIGSRVRPGDNDFDYSRDKQGVHCPLQAHVRRANPRATSFERPTSRIMRRGMSYGPTLKEDATVTDRGSVFMAYGASIAEQFEVIQRWINGGNSTGVTAAQNDPLIGVQPLAGSTTFRFIDGGNVRRVAIPGGAAAFVGLEWSLYLFAPSKAALARIAAPARAPAKIGKAARGEQLIGQLSLAPEPAAALAWKTLLEDMAVKDPELGVTPDVWAAIRDNHGGVLRTPQGVLVAGDALVQQVFLDPDGCFSVSGQAERMRKSFGEIYVGLDPGPKYNAQSIATNTAIMAVTTADAFAVSYSIAESCLNAAKAASRKLNGAYNAQHPAEIELRRTLINPTLAAVCNHWFGLPDGSKIVAGGWNWTPANRRKPQCPGDYMAPSRYCFYPNPTESISDYGVVQGRALYKATKAYFDALRPPPHGSPLTPPTAPLAAAMFNAIANNDLLARTVVGTMLGALPPIDGNLRVVLYDWTNASTLWRWQQALLARPDLLPDPSLPATSAALAGLCDWAEACLGPPMRRSMQKRPAPDLLWRTATKPTQLGDVAVQPGEKVILGLVSATIEKLNAGPAGAGNVFPVFGGDRRTPKCPVHACPGYEFAMGAMLGLLTALLLSGRIEATPGASMVKLSPASP